MSISGTERYVPSFVEEGQAEGSHSTFQHSARFRHQCSWRKGRAAHVDFLTFPHTAVRIFIWLIRHATHHVGGIHAGLVPWIWSHGVPLLERGITAICKGILKAHRVTPD